MSLAERELTQQESNYNPLVGEFDEVFPKFKRMAEHIARIYYKRMIRKKTDFRSLEFDDLYQVACEAFFESYRKYNHVGSITFSTHAFRTMQNRIRRFLNYKAEMIHVPILKKKTVKISVESYNRKGHTNGNFDSEPERESSDSMLNEVRGILAFEDDDTLPRVQDFLNGLDERHAHATIMRMEFYTMEEVGQELGTSRQRVHQLINKVREEYLFYELHGRHRKRGEKL